MKVCENYQSSDFLLPLIILRGLCRWKNRLKSRLLTQH